MSKWISVEDRLPNKEENDWVLVRVEPWEDGSERAPVVAELREGVWWGNFVYESPLEEIIGLKVTHWFPMESIEF